MTQIIIYPKDNNSIVLVYPTTGLPIEDVANKDVPAGVPYKIVDTADLPEDRTFLDAWEADFSNPDGYAIGAEAWFARQQEVANDND